MASQFWRHTTFRAFGPTTLKSLLKNHRRHTVFQVCVNYSRQAVEVSHLLDSRGMECQSGIHDAYAWFPKDERNMRPKSLHSFFCRKCAFRTIAMKTCCVASVLWAPGSIFRPDFDQHPACATSAVSVSPHCGFLTHGFPIAIDPCTLATLLRMWSPLVISWFKTPSNHRWF